MHAECVLCDSFTSGTSHHIAFLLAKQERRNQSERHRQQLEGEPSMQSITWQVGPCSSDRADAFLLYACLWTGRAISRNGNISPWSYSQMFWLPSGKQSWHWKAYFDLCDVTQTDNTRAPEQTFRGKLSAQCWYWLSVLILMISLLCSVWVDL